MNFDDYPLDAHTCHFQVGSCNIFLLSDLHIEKINLDYDTYETVTCSSFFIYDLERQRNLQHFIKIEELPTEFRILELPSGLYSITLALQRTQSALAPIPHKDGAFKNVSNWQKYSFIVCFMKRNKTLYLSRLHHLLIQIFIYFSNICCL